MVIMIIPHCIKYIQPKKSSVFKIGVLAYLTNLAQ